MATATYSIADGAYVKAMLHACKYPTRSVCGFLLGSEVDGVVRIMDAIPLFHQHPLAPMLEAASMMVEQYCLSDAAPEEGLVIVGLYCGNELLKDDSVSLVYGKIADHLVSTFKNCCVLVIDNQSLADPDMIAMRAVVQSAKGAWSRTTTLVTEDEGVSDLLNNSLAKHLEDNVCDFDEHFDDASKDWRNKSLLQT